MDTLREKLQSEHIIKEEPAQWIDSETLMQSGRLVLTKKHLVFLLNAATKPAVLIDLDTVNTITHETIVTDSNVLCIHYLQYNTAKFSVIDPEAWEKAIEEERMTPHIKMS